LFPAGTVPPITAGKVVGAPEQIGVAPKQFAPWPYKFVLTKTTKNRLKKKIYFFKIEGFYLRYKLKTNQMSNGLLIVSCSKTNILYKRLTNNGFNI
jgi:hypothetical protein